MRGLSDRLLPRGIFQTHDRKKSTQTYQQMILGTSGLVAYWPFSESAAPLLDAVTGSRGGGVYLNSGAANLNRTPLIKTGKSLQLTNNARVGWYSTDAVPPQGYIRMGNAQTYEFWAILDTLPGGGPARNLLYTTYFNTRIFTNGATDNFLQTQIQSQFPTEAINVNFGVVAAASLYHIVTTLQVVGGKLRGTGFLNGVQVSQVDAVSSATMTNTATDLEINSVQAGSGASAQYDELALYNRALSGSEVLAHYNKGITG